MGEGTGPSPTGVTESRDPGTLSSEKSISMSNVDKEEPTVGDGQLHFVR